MRQDANRHVMAAVAAALLGLLGCVTSIDAAAPPQPSGRLTEEQSQRLAEIRTRINQAASAGQFTEVFRLAQEAAGLRERWQGYWHWQAVDSRLDAAVYGQLARLPRKQQEQMSECILYNREAADYRMRGRYREAETKARKALEVSHTVLGEDHPFTATRYNNVAATLGGQGRYAQAQPLYERALAIHRKVLGEDHPDTAQSYDNLAVALSEQGKLSQAEPLYERALAIRRAALGEGHPDTANSYDNLAVALNDRGRFAQAQPLHEKALAIRRTTLGEDDRDTALSYNNLGLNLKAQSKYAQALSLFERALRIYRINLGEDNPDTAWSYNNLAGNLDDMGRHAQAQPLHEKALAIRRKTLGEMNARTAISYNNLATCLQAQGMCEQALPLFERALRIQRMVRGDEHPDTATAYDNLAVALDAQGLHAQAQPLLERALRIRRTALSDDHPDTATSYNNVALNLAAQGRHAQAQPLHQKALAIRRKLLGETHSTTASSYLNLASSFNAQNNHLQALPLVEKALGICRETLGEGHPDTATCYNNLGAVRAARREYALAQPLYERALAIRRAALGETHPDTATSHNNVATTLAEQGKYAEALPQFEKALAIYRETLGENHLGTARSYHNLAAALVDLGRYSQAQPLHEKALRIRRMVLGQDHPHTALCYLSTAFCLNAQGKHAEALVHLRAALPGHDSGRLYTTSSGFERSLYRAGFHTPRAVLGVTLAQLGEPLEAWQHAEADLARGLLEDFAAEAERPDQPMLARLGKLDERLVPLFGVARPTVEQQRLRESLTAQRREVLTELSQHAAERSAALLCPLERIQKQIPDDAALVLWVDVQNLHFGCVLRHQGPPRWQSLPGSGRDGAWTADDGRLTTRLYQALHDRTVSQAERERLLEQVRRQRLEPLRKLLQAGDGLPPIRRLLVVPTGSMAHLPVEVLAPAYTVSYIPSGSVFARLAERHRPLAGASLLALGDPIFDPSDQTPAAKPGEALLVQRGTGHVRLPGTRSEVQALARLVGPDRTTLLLGSNASEQQLDRLNETGALARFRLVHLATHGEVDQATPARSALILAQDRLPDPLEQACSGKKVYDGRLRVGTILHAWKLDADLVALSACQTGLGKDTGGNGLLGFAQVLLHKGARSVVLSRWKVDDTATALLMGRFYENVLGRRDGLKGPLPRAAALAEAKAWLQELSRDEAQKRAAALADGTLRGSVVPLRPLTSTSAKVPAGERPFAHPAYWSAFVLIGDPD